MYNIESTGDENLIINLHQCEEEDEVNIGNVILR